MRVSRVGVMTAAAAALVLTAGLAPQIAQAGTPGARPDPLAHPVAGLTSAAQMVEANGHLFVSSGTSGSDVEVLTTSGSRVTTITGEPGAEGMVVSADGSTVYVALANSDAISVIDTSTLAETARYTVESCPMNVALASGRLFYSYGCSNGSPTAAGVASIDPATGGDPVAALNYLWGDAMLRGSGSVLAATEITNTLYTYTAGSDGTLTALGQGSLEETPLDMAFTSDGNSVLVASGAPYQITSYSTDTVAQNLVYPGVAYPQAVATDPTGQYVAGGFESYGVTARLYGQTTDTIKWQRYTAGTNPSLWQTNESFDQMLPRTLVFSPTGAQLYGLVVRGNASGIFFFHSAIAPAASHIKVTVAKVGPGKKHTAVATLTGAHGAITFTMTDNGTSKNLGTANTNSHGVARMTFTGRYDGTVTASFEGSPSLFPASATTKFSVASKTTSRLVGPHTTRHGVAMYASYKDINVLFKTTPPEVSRSTKTDFEELRGGHWRIMQRLSGDENQYGLRVFFKSAPSRVKLRVRLIVAGDSLSRGSHATSKVFEVG
jgi:YVTN family beta-propeller protein